MAAFIGNEDKLVDVVKMDMTVLTRRLWELGSSGLDGEPPETKVYISGGPRGAASRARRSPVLKKHGIRVVKPNEEAPDIEVVLTDKRKIPARHKLIEHIVWTRLLDEGEVFHGSQMFAMRLAPPEPEPPKKRRMRTLAQLLGLPSKPPDVIALQSGATKWITWHPVLIRNFLRFARGVTYGCNILIEGETGVGKTALARAIHEAFNKGTLVATSGRGLSGETMQAELFGFEPGAFTGADRRMPGKLDRAKHGTLLIDEIDTLDPTAQASLLRFLEDRSYERLGSNRTLAATCTVIATSNVSLRRRVEEGEFSPELYARLAQHRLVLPPLRCRPEDAVGMLVREIAKLCATSRQHPPYLTGNALARLLAHDWPENARNVLALARVLVMEFPQHELTADEIEFLLAQYAPPSVEAILRSATGLRQLRNTIARAMLIKALERSDLNVSDTARLLRTSRARVLRYIKELGISAEQYKENYHARIRLLLQFGLV